MKFNWGTGLVIFFIIFVSTLFFILYKSTQYDNALVIDNYYEEDINYQSHYDKKQNTADLKEKLKIDYDASANTVLFSFPADTISPAAGTIWMYNPVQKSQDKTVPFAVDENMNFTLLLGNVSKGRLKLKIDWTQGGKEYYMEEELLIQ